MFFYVLVLLLTLSWKNKTLFFNFNYQRLNQFSGENIDMLLIWIASCLFFLTLNPSNSKSWFCNIRSCNRSFFVFCSKFGKKIVQKSLITNFVSEFRQNLKLIWAKHWSEISKVKNIDASFNQIIVNTTWWRIQRACFLNSSNIHSTKSLQELETKKI